MGKRQKDISMRLFENERYKLTCLLWFFFGRLTGMDLGVQIWI
jgi:hypothetical protein